MPGATATATPSINTFLHSLKTDGLETSIEKFISLLKRRQIRNSRPCAIATAKLLLRVVVVSKVRDHDALIQRVREVGRRLVSANPRELAVGNIVRRVLGVIREVIEQDKTGNADDFDVSRSSSVHDIRAVPPSPGPLSGPRQMPSLIHADSQEILVKPRLQSTNSLFGLLSQPGDHQLTPSQTPPTGTQSPVVGIGLTSGAYHDPTIPTIPHRIGETNTKINIKAEVLDGINQIISELDNVYSDIASLFTQAEQQQHIHEGEVILTHTSSRTVQRFLLAAARKRKFTVVHVESYPNDHLDVHSVILHGRKRNETETDDAAVATTTAGRNNNSKWKPLIAAGITVILIPDSAVFALMSRVNKVVLTPHSVLANGGLLAASGALTIAQAAKAHQTPVVVVSGVYKLSPMHHFDTDKLLESGDLGKVVGFDEGDMVDGVDVLNPLYDYVPAELVDLYITNLGGHAPSYLYRIIADHYNAEDIDLFDEGDL